jgi:hypothetical protein
MRKKVLGRKKKSNQEILDIQLAESRIGDTLESRLKWILNFKDQDLSTLSSGERATLGFSLRAFVEKGITFDAMSDEVLNDLQKWVRELFEVTRKKSPMFLAPPPQGYLISPVLRDKKVVLERLPQFDMHKDESLAIKHAIADTAERGSDKLRLCLQCRSLFVAHRKKVYCVPACSQKARDIKRGKSYLP